MRPYHEGLQDFLRKTDIEYREDVDFSEISYLKVGGIASAVLYPKNEDEFVSALRCCISNGIRHKTVGKMSNLLPPEFYGGILIKTDRLSKIRIDGEKVSVLCGRSVPSLASELCRRSLSGFEELSGIPGSVGGAVYMNAGAYGREISELLICLSAYDATCDSIVTLHKDELDFSYRHSCLLERRLSLVSAEFACKENDGEEVRKRMRAFAKKRRDTQPVSEPSLGSVFKKRDGVSAAYLIEKAGLKGLSVGGASVSEKHSGFIVNRGNASSRDYLELVRLVKRKVFEFCGVTLEEEIEYFD